MRKALVLPVVALVMSGCAGMLEIKGTGYTVDADTSYVAQSIDYMKSRLKDPESARISGVYTVKTDYTGDAVNVCGLVNAKNSYGGYTGSKLFAARPNIAYIEQAVIGSDYEAISNNNHLLTHCKLRDGEQPVFLKEFDGR